MLGSGALLVTTMTSAVSAPTMRTAAAPAATNARPRVRSASARVWPGRASRSSSSDMPKKTRKAPPITATI